MIGQLVGTLIEKSPGLVLLDVAGVGYEVEISLTSYANLPANDERTLLYTHMVVREDAQLLFGFLTRKERDLFRVLIKVNSVGPKLGLAILSGMDTATFARCVSNEDVNSLVSLPGVGRKTAGKIILEMRDRLQEWGDFEMDTAKVSARVDHFQDAEVALIGLGYKPQDAARALAQIVSDEKTGERGERGEEEKSGEGDKGNGKREQRSLENTLKQALKVLSN